MFAAVKGDGCEDVMSCSLIIFRRKALLPSSEFPFESSVRFYWTARKPVPVGDSSNVSSTEELYTGYKNADCAG